MKKILLLNGGKQFAHSEGRLNATLHEAAIAHLDRAGFDVPALSEHGFAWAVDRMIAGYLMSDAPEADRDRAFSLPDGTEFAPVTGIHGPSAEALGALDRFIQLHPAHRDIAYAYYLRALSFYEQIGRQLGGRP